MNIVMASFNVSMRQMTSMPHRNKQPAHLYHPPAQGRICQQAI